jgi:hypothetical protein
MSIVQRVVHAEAERVIGAPPEEIYAFLADYQARHPRILPPEHFIAYAVEEGGQGEGTIVRIRVRAGGRERPYRMRVSEPARGRVLQESDLLSSLVTRYTLVPLDDNRRTLVRVETEWDGAGGVGGFFERTFAPVALRRIYDEELLRLARSFSAAPEAEPECVRVERVTVAPGQSAPSLTLLAGVAAGVLVTAVLFGAAALVLRRAGVTQP